MNKNIDVQKNSRKQKIERRALLIVLICLLLAGVYFLNAVVYQLGQRTSLSLDLTANAAYEIGNDTKTFLDTLDKDVDIYVLSKPNVFSINSYFSQTQHIIEQYPKYSKHINLSYIDSVTDPNFSKKFPDLSLQSYDILVVCGDRVKQLHFNEMFNYSYDSSNNLDIVASRAEEAITAALLNVTSEKQLQVAVLTGNGVSGMSVFTGILTDNNYVVTNVNIATDPLDNTYDIALLLAPQVDLSEDALKKLSDFLYNNGNYGKMLIYTADGSRLSMPNMNTFLKEWGIAVGDGMILEMDANRAYQNPYNPIADYVDTNYKNLLIDSSMPMLMPVAHPLQKLYDSKDNYANDVLLQFGATSKLVPSDTNSNFDINKAQNGPFPAMLLCTKTIYDNSGAEKAKSEVLVSSSTEMLDSYCLQNSSLSNSKYLINVLNSIFEQKASVNIQSKSLAGMTLSVTTAQSGTIGILLFVVLPLVILVSGIGIWLVRRYK